MIGGGELLELLRKEAKDLGIYDSIVMPGMVSADDVKKYMLESDIYVMTSFTECFPMVLLEASTCRLPLVAFDVPVGPRALINDEENGYLIKNRNLSEMADKIVYLLENREVMQCMGKNAKENVMKYLPDSVMKKWDDIFEEKIEI